MLWGLTAVFSRLCSERTQITLIDRSNLDCLDVYLTAPAAVNQSKILS